MKYAMYDDTAVDLMQQIMPIVTGQHEEALRAGCRAIETLAKIRAELTRQRAEWAGVAYDDDDYAQGVRSCCAALEALLEPKP